MKTEYEIRTIDIHEIEARAHKMRAEALAAGVSRMKGWVVDALHLGSRHAA